MAISEMKGQRWKTIPTRNVPTIGISQLSAVLPIIGIGGLVLWYRPIVVYEKM